MLESLFNKVAGFQGLKITCFEEHLRTTASTFFKARLYRNSEWQHQREKNIRETKIQTKQLNRMTSSTRALLDSHLVKILSL